MADVIERAKPNKDVRLIEIAAGTGSLGVKVGKVNTLKKVRTLMKGQNFKSGHCMAT